MSAGICALYVDDDADVVETTVSSLERKHDHIEVVVEASAAGALDRVANMPIDCIVSAYQLPDMDGLELLETVRDEHPDLPFILFTDTGSEELASEAISADVTDYIPKESVTAPHAMLADRIEIAVEQSRSYQGVEQERTHRSAPPGLPRRNSRCDCSTSGSPSFCTTCGCWWTSWCRWRYMTRFGTSHG